MHLLGVSYNYHDAAACLVRDGVPIAAAEEERFSRIKHDARFPAHAIHYCLSEAGIEASGLDGIAFYEKPARKLERALILGKRYMPLSAASVAEQYRRLIEDGLGVPDTIREHLGYAGPIYYSEHHLAHAASAFHVSPFREAAVMVADGVGEWATYSEFLGDGSALAKLREVHYPHSLGLLYASLTAYLGFRVNDDEYKVMGLASYGTPTYRAEIEKLISFADDGSFALDLKYFSFMHHTTSMYSEMLVELLGPPRHPGDPIETRHRDIAASLQAVIVDAMVRLATGCRKATGSNDLCLAGGVAYNCVANSQILARSGFERIFVQPAAGDSGAAMGAALWAYHIVRGGPRYIRPHDTLLGPEFSNDEIGEALEEFGVAFETLDEASLCGRTADLIQRGLIVGWFQGRMEFGPRALGCRSILANPCLPEMKDVLNARIKFREDFRPFAPAVTEEAAQIYFEMDAPSPFMLLTPRVRRQ